MRIEAVTVCVDYADFLREVIPHNRIHFDRWLIVTSPRDEATRELCRKHNLECLVTEDFYKNGNPFNKGAAVERGLTMCRHDGWMLHIDGDVVLPADFRESLDDADLDPTCLHGVDRFNVKGWDAWQALKRSGWLSRDYHCRSNAHPDYSIGTRWCDTRFGYVPIGFFQLWHPSADQFRGTRTRRYPGHHQDAARADVQFALQWDRRRRVLIPEIVVAHLESGPVPLGVNWKGRKSAPFGPPEHGLHKPHPSPCHPS